MADGPSREWVHTVRAQTQERIRAMEDRGYEVAREAVARSGEVGHPFTLTEDEWAAVGLGVNAGVHAALELLGLLDPDAARGD